MCHKHVTVYTCGKEVEDGYEQCEEWTQSYDGPPVPDKPADRQGSGECNNYVPDDPSCTTKHPTGQGCDDADCIECCPSSSSSGDEDDSGAVRPVSTDQVHSDDQVDGGRMNGNH